MTISRYSLAAIAALLIFGAGYAYSDHRHEEEATLERVTTLAEAKLIRNTIVAQCQIPEKYLATSDELDEAVLPGYEMRPLTLSPDYGFCPQSENEDKIRCADRVAMQAGYILGRPPVIGECPRLGIAE